MLFPFLHIGCKDGIRFTVILHYLIFFKYHLIFKSKDLTSIAFENLPYFFASGKDFVLKDPVLPSLLLPDQPIVHIDPFPLTTLPPPQPL